ncbi:hypothetical protein [Streptomyces hydrogenans]|uniref:hypothetical protein n=1 Tax=Streptomyces hydrogenans TaxID=1873719 RepID=UPI001CFDE357|nr:hypothetical protein [Streptomyces hydrogenans]
MTAVSEAIASDDFPPLASALLVAAAERQVLIERWAERHGVDAARRLAEAEDLADAVAAEITPDNTTDTYDKSWRVWQRFCTVERLPELEGSRGSLVAFVAWMLREGQQNGKGYAPSSASTHLAATVVGLRQRGVAVSGYAQAEARADLEGLAMNSSRPGSGVAGARPSAPTSTACTPSPAPAPTPSPARGTRPWSSPASATPPAPRTRPDSSPATSRCTRTASWSTSSLARPSTPCAPHGCRTTRIPRSARSAPGPPTAPA